MDVVVAEALEWALHGRALLNTAVAVASIDPTFCPGQTYQEPAGFTAQQIVWASHAATAPAELGGFDAPPADAQVDGGRRRPHHGRTQSCPA